MTLKPLQFFFVCFFFRYSQIVGGKTPKASKDAALFFFFGGGGRGKLKGKNFHQILTNYPGKFMVIYCVI